MADQPTTKKFAKGERSIPHHSQKASKYYPADDAAVPKKVRSRRYTTSRRKRREHDAAESTQQNCQTVLFAHSLAEF